MDHKQEERVIVLVDMDCFYVQVEQKLSPEYHGKPCAVVQYNSWKGGGIIAVNYEARAKGVKRGMRGDEAQKECPDIHLFKVPEIRGKADLTRYREAGAAVLEVLCEFSDCVERASIDEAYLDMTSAIDKMIETKDPVLAEQLPNTFVVGWENKDNRSGELSKWLESIYEEHHLQSDRKLALAAVIVEEMRAAVYTRTGYRCSAGIAHNKMLAKLSCGLHKPNKQTVLPSSSVPLLYDTLPVQKVRNLGGKFGEQVVKVFDASSMGDLMKISKAQFLDKFGEKSGLWLYNLSRGIESEPVVARQLPKSIGCGKNFPGKSCLNTKEKVSHWVKQLSIELVERLVKDQESNKRVSRLLTMNVRSQSATGFTISSRSCPIHVYNLEKIAHDACLVLQKFNTASTESPLWNPPILSLAMCASKFEDRVDNSTCDIQTYFQTTKSIDKTQASTTKSSASSHIDTVIDLLDEDKKQTETKRTGLAKYFPNLLPGASRSDSSTVIREENVSASKNICDKNSEHPLADEETNTDGEPSSKKVKGFFARKLEEKLRLQKLDAPNTSESTTQHSLFQDNKMTFGPSTSKDYRNECDDSNSVDSPPITDLENIDCTELPPEVIDDHTEIDNGKYADLDPELTKLCVKCSTMIPIWEEEEHFDYHIALDLSKELSKESTPKVVSSIIRPVTIRKRGRGSKTAVSKKSIQCRTLDSFFGRSKE